KYCVAGQDKNESNAHPIYTKKLVLEFDRTEYTDIFWRARWPNAQRVLEMHFFNGWKSILPRENEANPFILGRSTIHGMEREIRRLGGIVLNSTTTGDIKVCPCMLAKEILPNGEVVRKLVKDANVLIKNNYGPRYFANEGKIDVRNGV
ncbi:hypothetical protein G4B88_026805, partial [Cannabis sativa]